ncbi:chemotaxis protein CheW [Pseudokineococcus basanitobsidens]|uniref:histidine kinase n=1 Tax=Pseudokineococcus basanitobsidens TaxID=1926649 RepID=A0ABU8RG69_9ACTN
MGDDLEGMAEIVAEFLVESAENLDDLDAQLVGLEADPGDRPLLAAVFRTVHTIKGTSGFLAFPDLERLAHAGETLLARLRDGRAEATPTTVTVLLHLVDALRDLLARVGETGSDAGADLEGVLAEIAAEVDGGAAPPAPAGLAGPDADAEAAVADPEDAAQDHAAPDHVADPDDVAGPALGLVPDGAGPGGVHPDGRAGAPDADHDDGAPGRRRGPEASVRVDVDLLEELMTLVGELVLTRNQVLERAAASGDAEVVRAAHRLDVVAGELQRGVVRARMQPIDHVWSKLPRVVRDLGTQLGRRARLVVDGADTELDRTLLEAVRDPLTHLVRNAVDHGLEPPEERVAAGKDPVGVVALRARHEGGQVLVEVADDGRGMDVARIGARALERGLVDAPSLRAMTAEEVLDLVFAPGFSTADVVTSTSGRGVGMDVVRTNLERIGGSVELETTPGRGSTTRLRVPLTLAILPALLVTAAGQRFAVPQNGLRELVALDAERPRGGAERVGGAEVLRLRGRLLPLVRLRTLLGLDDRGPDEGEAPAGGAGVVAVLEAAGRTFGLVVDGVLATQEIVVKPLGALLADLPAYAGATVLGDGGLALILDVRALARSAREVERPADAAGAPEAADDGTQLLLVRVGPRRLALPLEVVTRLEDVPRAHLERVGHRWAVQHRGEVLPVLDLAEHLGEHVGDHRVEEGSLSLVVHALGDRSVALAVDEVLDVAPAASARTSHLGAPGLSGSAVVAGRIVELLDVRQAVLAADSTFYDDVEERARAGALLPPRPRTSAEAARPAVRGVRR